MRSRRWDAVLVIAVVAVAGFLMLRQPPEQLLDQRARLEGRPELKDNRWAVRGVAPGMTREEAEELLGPPAQVKEHYTSWLGTELYYDPGYSVHLGQEWDYEAETETPQTVHYISTNTLPVKDLKLRAGDNRTRVRAVLGTEDDQSTHPAFEVYYWDDLHGVEVRYQDDRAVRFTVF